MSISVLLPVYNNAVFISNAIQSILGQTYNRFELIVLDDGSEDNTKDIISRFEDSRIRYIKKEHTGLWDTLNFGLKIANNNLVARMDADDIALPNRLEKQVNLLKSNPQIDVVSSWYAVFENKIMYIVKTSEHSYDIKRRMLLHSEIVHSGLVYKKDKILSLGGYGDYKIEDLELWLRNLDNLVFYNIQEVLTLVRYRKDSNFNSDLIQRNQEIYSFLQKYQDQYFSSFNLNINILKGWKEYFYGDKNLSRKYFIKLKLKILFNPRILLAFMFSYLNDNCFIKLKENRLKFRILYLLNYFVKDNKLPKKILSIYSIEK